MVATRSPLPAIVSALASMLLGLEALGAAPPATLFAEAFECGNSRRWAVTQGGSVPPGPPVGVFAPQTVCEWTAPEVGDPYPAHTNVLATPLVADLPPGAPGSLELVVVTYNGTDGGDPACKGSDANFFGVLRLIDAATCAPVANVSGLDEKLIATAAPAIGDLDGDGTPEIVALRARDSVGAAAGLVAVRWDPIDNRYERWWATTGTSIGSLCRWDGPVIHDLDDDGLPEVISATEVYAGTTGARLDDGSVLPAATLGWLSVGDVDADAHPELVGTGVWEWNVGSGSWVADAAAAGAAGSTAYADFGTPDGAGLDASVRDGIAELVRSNSTAVTLERLDGTAVFTVAGAGAGPPAIGDFDGDGLPEVAVASGGSLRVLDLDCAAAGAGCVGGYVRWQSTIRDLASGRATATAMDLDVDGRLEVLHADECWARVFDGLTGDVLASVARRSCTWSEGVPIADGGGSARLFVASNANCTLAACDAVDPIQRGVHCTDGAHCGSGVCDAGYCRCSTAAECPAAHACTTPPGGTPGSGNTCRADRTGAPTAGVRVVGDVANRWGPAGRIWNQIPFSVTNVEIAGGIPATSQWEPNFLIPGRNDFRAADSVCAPWP